mmetsp:Transcript_11276/g.25566  ORF Transcript_11276/g.25566 Transcript_11276/m.25566 type:complete len:256 (+) Transcript_11276:1-768(+)
MDRGTTPFGTGASAKLDGVHFALIKDSPSLATRTFTVAFWLYLTDSRKDAPIRTVLSKGDEEGGLTPAILLLPDGRLQVVVSSDAAGQEAVITRGAVRPRRWVHVAVTSGGSVLRVYLNGLKEGELLLQGQVVASQGPYRLGRDPWRVGTKGFLDDLRLYNYPLELPDIKALVSPALAPATPGSDVTLGCQGCTWAEAAKACSTQGSLCSLRDLYSGGFHLARRQGWLTEGAELHHTSSNRTAVGVGLCCTEDEG